MKLTVLVDNNSLIDRYLTSEPGLSVHIDDGECRTLLDVGYSDVFIRNASKLRIDLFSLDFVVFSHGHLDHTWGLDPLVKMYSDADFEGFQFRRPEIVAHERLFESVGFPPIREFSSLMSREKLARHFNIRSSRTPIWLSSRLVYLGEIERRFAFESKLTFGQKEGSGEADSVPDDSALAYRGDDGLVIITGCSHSGICNIVEQARRVCGDDRIVDIVGGLHLMNPSDEQLEGTKKYVGALGLKQLHACHCTDLRSKIALAEVAPIQEVGSGTRLEFR